MQVESYKNLNVNRSKRIAETERLWIEEVTLNDTDFFLELLNCPGWIEFIGDKGVKTEQDAKGYIQESIISSYKENGFGLYKIVLRQSEIPIGICGFLRRDYLEYADLGFAMLPKYERKGYTFEAAEEMVRRGKVYFSSDPILAITTTDNLPSRSLLVKLGFDFVDTIKAPKEDEELLLYSTG